jgi:TRAP-type C4-dicarboxylate transport system substrate-binding protein
MESLLDFKLGEVVKFSVEDFGAAYTTTFFLVMNRAKWNSLSKEVQQVIDALSEEFTERQGRLWDDLDREGREFTLSKGNKIVQLSREENERWAEAVKPLLGAYVKKAKSRGLPGDDAVKFCLDYLRANQK